MVRSHSDVRCTPSGLGAGRFHDACEGAPQDPATGSGETDHEANEWPEPGGKPGASDARVARGDGGGANPNEHLAISRAWQWT